MAGPFLTRDQELFVQLEAAWGTSPGALAGTDAFKSHTGKALKRIRARYDRDKDKDNDQASVLTTQKGRVKSSFEVGGDVIPSGNAAAPTAPDIDPFLEAHFGQKLSGTAHTTLAAGSTTTQLELTPGGGAASGVAAGQIVVVDVSAAFGLEARQVLSVATDTVVLDRALSAAPAAARAVYLGVTYRLLHSANKSVHLWEFANGNNFRQKAGGCIVRELGVESDWSSEAPVSTWSCSGEGNKVEAQTATGRPTPTTAGEPQIPAEGKVWMGTTKLAVVKASFKSNNGLELRQNDSSGLYPTAARRTGNNSRYMVEAAIALLLQTGTIEGYYDNEEALTAYDLLVQLGTTVGKIVVWRCRRFIPDVPVGEQDGEVSLELGGRCLGNTGDDEIVLAFI